MCDLLSFTITNVVLELIERPSYVCM